METPAGEQSPAGPSGKKGSPEAEGGGGGATGPVAAKQLATATAAMTTTASAPSGPRNRGRPPRGRGRGMPRGESLLVGRARAERQRERLVPPRFDRASEGESERGRVRRAGKKSLCLRSSLLLACEEKSSAERKETTVTLPSLVKVSSHPFVPSRATTPRPPRRVQREKEGRSAAGKEREAAVGLSLPLSLSQLDISLSFLHLSLVSSAPFPKP